MNRKELAVILRKAGFKASVRTGRFGYTGGFNSWNLGSSLYVTYSLGTGNSGSVETKNAEILAALQAAGVKADYCTNYADGRIEIF
jgi:hypothetical protein